MSDLEFSVPAFNLLLALVHRRGSGTTTDFEAAFGFKDVKKDARDPLLDRGLIAIDRGVRPYVYELTDAGWLTARQLLSQPAPKGISNRTARILWAIMGDFATYMDRAGTELADIYPPPAPTDPRDAIRDAYRELVEGTSGWVSLKRLRKHLDGIDRATLDKALIELVGSHAIRLIPESNQKTLTREDREAALWLGGEYLHLIAIEAL
ncbi:hypothetical protein GCM10027447_29580 [Glycomyces halotolerans]